MFTVAERDRVRERVLKLAESDPRVVAAAVVGSLAHGSGDRWSDLDLSFGVAPGVSVADVMEDWTREMVEAFDAVTLLDIVRGPSTYRVFLLPRWLQVDLSFTPAAEFRQTTQNFRLLFGTHKTEFPPAPPAHELFGYAVLFARHSAVCVARGDPWQAEHMISAVRDYALMLACLSRGLPTAYGRGFDRLPPDVIDGFDETLVRSLQREELLRALDRVIEVLVRQSAEVPDIAEKVEAQLRELITDARRTAAV